MLAIAYFEPPGKTFEVKKPGVIDHTACPYIAKPNGIQQSNAGQGEKQAEQQIKPLEGKRDMEEKARAGQGKVAPKSQPAAKAAAVQGTKLDSYIDPAELDKIKKQLAEKQAEIDKLKQTQKEGTGGAQPPSNGQGDNYYIDLRAK